MSFDLQGAFDEFMSECEEITQRISSHLQSLEKGAESADILDAIYRDVHTLKGSANLYGFKQIGQLAHAVEACMDPYRKNLSKISPITLDTLFKSLDVIEKILAVVKETRNEVDFSKDLADIIPHLIESTASALKADFTPRIDPPLAEEDIKKLEAQIKEAQALLNETGSKSEPVSAPVEPKLSKENTINSVQKTKMETLAMESNSNSNSESNQGPAPDSAAPSSTPANDLSQTIRVPISRLDKLMNLIGEMVLVRNQVLQFSKHSIDSDFLKLGKRLDLVTSELQGEVMQTRMQPIGAVLDKFQRVVRDLNKELGKKIDLVLVGTETEVDKTLLEAVKDPLTHLIRNACDHGLETPAERKAAGKNETGKVTVRSFHEGGQVVIEISDDGRGLDKDRILAKAIERNLVDQQGASKLSDQEIYNFIFEPGFSTAKNVTTVSGRGVGMDVVRTNIEKIGGNIELSTVPKQGSTIRLKIPLTLAIVPAMVIRVGENRFAIPQVKLVELVRAQKAGSSPTGGGEDSGRNQVEYLQGKPMFRMRGDLLPLVSLKEVLQVPDDADLKEKKNQKFEDDVTNIVVLNGDGFLFGLIVDEIQDTTDIVVKPLSRFLKNLSIYSGATIMGDGSVVLIFDILGIAKKAQLNTDTRSTRKKEEAGFKSQEIQEFLLFKTAAATRHAMALCLVQRLEEFDRNSIEYAGSQPVIRYRGTILPLVSLNHHLSYTQDPKPQFNERLSAIVVQKFGRNFGLVVDEILDVITSESVVDDAVKDRPGLLGSLLQDKEIIVVVDPLEIVDSEFRKMQRMVGLEAQQEQTEAKERKRFDGIHILYAEDTPFFRKQVTRALEKLGIKVTNAVDGQDAINKLESEPQGTFSMILSDIEMPNMTGFQLAEAVRASEKLKSIPMMALTTRFKGADQEEGQRVGFNLYLEKFNSDQVIDGIQKLLKIERKAA